MIVEWSPPLLDSSCSCYNGIHFIHKDTVHIIIVLINVFLPLNTDDRSTERKAEGLVQRYFWRVITQFLEPLDSFSKKRAGERQHTRAGSASMTLRS